MCLWAEVSRSGYYEWLTRPTSATAARRFWLAVQVKKIFKASNSVYGYRKIHAELLKRGIEVGDELVRRLMGDLGLVSCHPRRCVRAGRPTEAGLHRPRAWRAVRWRHHLHPNLGRLALFGDGHRPVHQRSRRLGDGGPYASLARMRRAHHGRQPSSCHRGCRISFGSGMSIHV